MDQKLRQSHATKTVQSKTNPNPRNSIDLRPSTLKRAANPADNIQTQEPRTKIQRLGLSGALIDRKTLIADLPFEIVQDILRKVQSTDLLNCRQVNRQWNEISSRILRQRADITISFVFKDVEFMHRIQYRRCEALLVDHCRTFSKCSGKSLTDLVVCLGEATNFPFTSFQVNDVLKFKNSDMRSFLAVWGKYILTLNVAIDTRINDVGILRKLLFDRVPNLKKLHITFCRKQYTFPAIELCADDSSEFHFPHLEVLCVTNRIADKNGIVEKILRAASNLNNFDKNGELVIVPDLQLFQSLNKLHCLKNVNIHVSEELVNYWPTSRESMDLMMILSLDLSFALSIRTNERLKSRAAEIINQWFRSSKNVMHSLSIPMLGWLTGLVIPKLNRLQKLSLLFNYSSDAMFPPLLNMASTFPNVKELHIEGMRNETRLHANQSLSTMSSVEILRISFDDAEATLINEQLMQMTPNVKTLLMVNDQSFHADTDEDTQCPVDFQKISKYWPKLENLGWQICTWSHEDVLHKLDAVMTGFSETFCEKYSEKFRNRYRLSANEVAAFLSKRKKSSILDLKALKRLDINFSTDTESQDESSKYENGYDYPCAYQEKRLDEAGFSRDDDMFFRTGFTKVSKFLALDLMPNLKIRTHKTME